MSEIITEGREQALRIRIINNIPIPYCPLHKKENLPSQICKSCTERRCIDEGNNFQIGKVLGREN